MCDAVNLDANEREVVAAFETLNDAFYDIDFMDHVHHSTAGSLIPCIGRMVAATNYLSDRGIKM